MKSKRCSPRIRRVQDVGVAGVPDDVKGEVVKAWVVKRSGTNPTVDELRAYCRQNLAPYKSPVHVEFRDVLPKTMAGKVLRRALVAEHQDAGKAEVVITLSTRMPACFEADAHGGRQLGRGRRIAMHANRVDL